MMIYVAAPYNHPDPVVVELRMTKFAEVMADLIKQGKYPVSPLMNHFLTEKVQTNFPLTWEFWEGYSFSLLSKCSELVVIKTDPEWSTSKGVAGEIEMASKILGLPVHFINKID